MQGKVEDLGIDVQKKVIKLSVEGVSAQSIADQINSENESELTRDNIATFIERKRNQTNQLIREDKNYEKKIADQYFNTIQQLGALNAELWKLFYEIKKDPEIKEKQVKCEKCGAKITLKYQNYLTLLKACESILSQIKHVDTVLGRMKNKSVINYNFVDMSNRITKIMPEMLDKMEKRGICKVNRKRLKNYFST
jgi:hypothetical protein